MAKLLGGHGIQRWFMSMFRTTKKKKTAISRSIRRTDDSDDEETGPIVIQPIRKDEDDSGDGSDGAGGTNLALLRAKQRQKKSKKQRMGTKESSNLRTTVKSGGSSKSKKRQRIGFGGSSISNENISSEENDEGDTQSSSLYDIAALAQLKAEQAQWRGPDEEAREIENQKTSTPQDKEIKTHDSTKMSIDDQEDFIPLNQNNQGGSETILAGDEAFDMDAISEYETKPADFNNSLQNVPKNKGETIGDDEESDELWQDRISQRAGVSVAKSDRKASPIKTSSKPNRSFLALEELRQQFADAQGALENQMNDANSVLKRRQVDIEHTEETEIQQHLDTVQKHGKALEFYQGWRAMAVPHVAALRDLDDKLDKIQTLVVEMLVKATNCHRNRVMNEADDLFASLKDCSVLDRIVGRQPEPSIFLSQDTTVQVDEFGRSVKSQHILEREKRVHEREKIEQKRKHGENDKADGFDEDDWMTPNEAEDLNEQKSSLNEALQFALSQIKPDFADISVLAVLFSDWMHHNIHEYKECYAGLSFADLGSVLLRRDMYYAVLTGDRIRLETLGYAGDDSVMKLLDRDAATRLDEKSVIPLISDLVKQKAYGFASKSRTVLLTSIVKNAFCSTPGTHFQKTIKEPLILDMKSSLDNIGLPVLSTESSVTNGNFLTSIQVEATDRLFQYVLAAVESIILWDRAIGLENMGGYVLDFLLSTFLTSISSVHSMGEMHKNEKLRSLARNSFLKVWADVQSTSWMQNTDWLVQATTLQAAASAYLDQ